MLKVLDFYTDRKISVNNVARVLMRDTLFCIMVELDGKAREFALTVTKKYHFKPRKEAADYIVEKVNEYNVLWDYLLHSKFRVKANWKISESDYQELLAGLELCLVERYARCGWGKRVVLFGKGLVKRFIVNLKRRVGLC